MELFAGWLDLPWWGHAVAALALTHVTIASVTIFLHRHQAHRALDLHPAASHFFRAWLWLSTGMVTREWVAVHRKHHAKCDTAEDPHSPQVLGLNRVLWGGVFLYVKEANRPDTIERYGQGTPDDWLERNVYDKLAMFGVFITLAIDLLLFGVVPGALVWLTQIAWIPFWAAGVINGIGHYWGYRSWPTPDASTNIVPLGILIGGEELHNNHHAYPTSAKLSSKWYEFDLGWLYIRALEALGLARVKHLAPVPRIKAPKPAADLLILQAVIRNRYDVLARFARSMKRAYAAELERMRRSSPEDARALEDLGPRAGSGRENAPRPGPQAAGCSVAQITRPQHNGPDAARARRRVGTLGGLARAAGQAVAGLVPARRGERHRVAGRAVAAPSQLRIVSAPYGISPL
jgi:stearoyl-CoA desaturase (delta-9 desaturase)